MERAVRWWRENRPAAPRLLEREFDAALDLLETTPETGRVYPTVNERVVRRVLLPKTRHHVYYEINLSRQEVRILIVWSAVRGRGPKLG